VLLKDRGQDVPVIQRRAEYKKTPPVLYFAEAAVPRGNPDLVFFPFSVEGTKKRFRISAPPGESLP